MAREIIVELNGATSSFAFSKIDRAKLYGSRRRVNLDPDGERCSRADLTADGSMLIRSGMTAQGYFDEVGYWHPNASLMGLDAEDNVAEKHSSTLGAVQTGVVVEAQELLDQQVAAVYALEASDVDDGLKDSLEGGAIVKIKFVYRSSNQPDSAYLVHNAEGYFALIGKATTPIWRDLEAVVEDVFEEDDGFDDDLDFEMF